MVVNRQKINCRGENSRRKLVRKYKLMPVTHTKLLNGQEKWSCTGETLTDRYYCFSYESLSGCETGTFFCGYHAAKHFLKLLNMEDLPLFNPLKHEGDSYSHSLGKKPSSVKRWNELAKRLWNATNLIVVYWNSPPKMALANIKAEIERDSNKEPPLRLIKAVNTIISFDSRGKKLREMLDELSENNNIRDFSFDVFNRKLENEGIESYFG